MPIPRHAAALPAPTLHAALVALRGRGVRLSGPRRRLLEHLYEATDACTAEQLAGAGAGDVATVYRNLGALEAAGVVRHSHRPGGAARWAPAAAVHEAAECDWCGRRQPVDARALDQLRAVARQLLGFELHLDHTPLPGLCGACAARARAA